MTIPSRDFFPSSRRKVLLGSLGVAAAITLPAEPTFGADRRPTSHPTSTNGHTTMASRTFRTKDGTEIFYKDWGAGQAIVFHHGWPLSADDWDGQMLFFLAEGYRVIAYDRRGHGRSTQTDLGNDMDTYAADSAALVEHLGLKNAIHVGHSTGGGEVIRYIAQYGGSDRVAKGAIINAITPVMIKKSSNPGGTPVEVFDGFRKAMANRAQLYRDIAEGPFYGFNRPGVEIQPALVENWWRQGMMGGAKAHYDCIRVFSETDHTEDLKQITQPVLVMHSEDDQIVPYANSGPLAAKLLQNGSIKAYKDMPHGMAATHADIINADLLTYFRT